MINYWAILVSAIAAMVIGGIWWGPLFGKQWMAANGFDRMAPEQREAMKKSMAGAYIQQFIVALIQASVLAYLIVNFADPGAVSGMKMAALLWLGFIAPVQYGAKLWGGQKFSFVLLTFGNTLLTMLAMGAIIGAW